AAARPAAWALSYPRRFRCDIMAGRPRRPAVPAVGRNSEPAMKRAPWSLAARFLVRDWKSGEVLVLLIALVVAVAAIGAVTFFTDRVRQTMAQQAGEALAADLRVESTLPLPEELFREAAARGLETARIVHF